MNVRVPLVKYVLCSASTKEPRLACIPVSKLQHTEQTLISSTRKAQLDRARSSMGLVSCDPLTLPCREQRPLGSGAGGATP
jgi:hypothetical protein